jgi:hypothetical protein
MMAGVVLAVTLLAACGTSTSSQATSTAAPANTVPAADARADGALLLRRSYSPDYHLEVPIGASGTLLVFHSVCTGSADGHCQAVDAFEGTRPVWHREYQDVLRVAPAANGFIVRSATYKASDPLCCPSGGESTESFVWRAGHVVRLGAIA